MSGITIEGKVTIAGNTVQTISADSVEGKRFLRAVRDRDYAMDAMWKVRASAATDYKLEFSREIAGGIGEPNKYVTVLTDIYVSGMKHVETQTKQSFSDSKPVLVLAPRSIWLNWSTVKLLAKFILDGATLNVSASAGSTASSEHGLAFYSLEARFGAFADVSIGGETITVNGKVICQGVVDFK